MHVEKVVNHKSYYNGWNDAIDEIANIILPNSTIAPKSDKP